MADIATGLQSSYMAAAQVLHRARRHAASAAARFAVVIGVARLGRALRRNLVQRSLGGVSQSGFGRLLATDRILALAAVPLIVVAIQSASSSARAASDSSHRTAPISTVAVPAGSPAGGVGALKGGASGALPTPGALSAGATSVLNAAIASGNRSIGKLPVPPTISAIPSLPSVSATLPPLPVPTPSLPPVLP